MTTAYERIQAERDRQVAKGRDDEHDDARTAADWTDCLRQVIGKTILDLPGNGTDGGFEALRTQHAERWRAFWTKIGSVAVAAIESSERTHPNKQA